MEYNIDIGVFGGSGFYSFLENVEEIEMDTPYGKPSDKFAIATFEGKKIAFLPRHAKSTIFRLIWLITEQIYMPWNNLE